MGESAAHMDLVDCIRRYAISKVPEGEEGLVLYDSPSSEEKPSRNRDGFRPDVEYHRHNFLIIGDAKTSKDLESRHSQQQIESYIRDCHDFSGESLLVIGVPFADSQRACSVIGSMQQRLNARVSYAVVNEAGLFAES